MSEYGIKIKNIEAGTLYEYNLGVRDHYEYKNAMFTNSLFNDFITSHGLRMHGKESTRDIICIEFNFGSRSYEDEIKHLQKLIKQTMEVIAYLENPEEDFSYLNEKEKKKKDKEIQRVLKYLKEYKNSTVEYELGKLDKLNNIMKTANLNADKYCKKSKEDIRIEYYENGVDVEYIVKDKNGKIKDKEIIHYKMLYRTPGKAKKGSCMFINEKLYDEAIDFLRMGIKLPEKNSPIIEIGAYSSLITSTIVGKIKINPENILILKDVDSFFETKVVSVETDENKHCIAKTIDNYKLKNTLFDGQALIDHSIFPEWGDGYILLRQHFCKMAAFDCHIQKFFKDYYGDEYETAIVKDMFGNDHYVKDIELITTDNAIKWAKFQGVTYEYWCDKVKENGSLFGIVKTAHKSKLGDVQKMSYQMVNALDINAMDEITRNSVEYVEKLKKDNNAFLEYLKKNSNFSNDFEVLVALCEHSPEFVRCDYFRKRKKDIINTYVLNLKTGKVIQNGDNLVIVGSPYAMLLHAVGEDVNKDDTFCHEDGTIQCYTGRFEDGEYLAAFRNPFNSRNNLTYLHNVYNDKLNKYFEFGEQIIAVNLIGTDFQDHNNGSDQDSDSVYTTNQADIVRCAKEYYRDYPTIVNNIPMLKNNYDNSLKNFALIDNKLAASQLTIGESSNLAQICLSYSYNFTDKKYQDYVCILSVLA